jgi:hypothetical protein
MVRRSWGRRIRAADEPSTTDCPESGQGALAVPLDDSGLALAAALVLRGGWRLLMLDQ